MKEDLKFIADEIAYDHMHSTGPLSLEQTNARLHKYEKRLMGVSIAMYDTIEKINLVLNADARRIELLELQTINNLKSSLDGLKEAREKISKDISDVRQQNINDIVAMRNESSELKTTTNALSSELKTTTNALSSELKTTTNALSSELNHLNKSINMIILKTVGWTVGLIVAALSATGGAIAFFSKVTIIFN